MEAHDCNWRDDIGLGCINDRCPLHRAMRTLAHNLAIAGALCASFRAGDNFGFHMGSDEGQCTCQWSPGNGEPHQGATRCERDEWFQVDEPLGCCPRNTWGDEFHDPGCGDDVPAPGPNGCVCGSNGDCNCPYVEV